MSEQEWLNGTDARLMLDFLLQQDQVSERKLRLLAVAYCRHHGGRYQSVDVAERFADGLADQDELKRSEQEANDFVWIDGSRGWMGSLFSVDQLADVDVVSESAEKAARKMIGYGYLPKGMHDDIFEHRPVPEPDLLREIFGNPFRSVTMNPSWLSPKVVALAQSIYDGRAFDRLALLADVLETAGCTDRDILQHCRQPGKHVRGCWVVDLVLGKK